MAFLIVHEAGAAINAMAEIVYKTAQAAGKTPFDIHFRNVVFVVADLFSQRIMSSMAPPVIPARMIAGEYVFTFRRGALQQSLFQLLIAASSTRSRSMMVSKAGGSPMNMPALLFDAAHIRRE